MTDWGELARAMRRVAEAAIPPPQPPPGEPPNHAAIGDTWGILVTRKDGSVRERREVVRGESRIGDLA